MERVTTIIEAEEIMGSNFIGNLQLELIVDKMPIYVPENPPPIPFNSEVLKKKRKDHILILGTSKMQNGEPLTIKSLRSHFGINPDISEPCFYNQDWYLNERFIEKTLEPKWFLLRKSVFPESRGKNPDELKTHCFFPSAILCTYSFFVFWTYYKEILWETDFVWCSDIDINNDMVYVGRYIDISGYSKNGFSIHRHLNIRKNYGCINFL
jgi:hypothetical protein